MFTSAHNRGAVVYNEKKKGKMFVYTRPQMA